MRIVRLTLVGSLGLALVLLVGCKSNNEGKIVGKWQMVPTDAGAAADVKVYMEFTAAGKFSMYGTGPANTKTGGYSGTYRLGFSDMVYLDNLSPPMQGQTSGVESIQITGDQLKMKDDEKGDWVVWNRVKTP